MVGTVLSDRKKSERREDGGIIGCECLGALSSDENME